LSKVWLIGGTQESAQIARELVRTNLPCVVSVTTESARLLYPPEIEVSVCKFTPQFLEVHPISVVLDASHPFAVEISQSAIAIATERGIPYLRFERSALSSTDCQTLKNFDQLDILKNERVLLTIGYRSLSLFKPWQDQAVLFTRILPSAIALQTALESGFTSDRILAIRPPISIELERSLWQHWQISMVLTKASGSPGGEDLKHQVAKELGVKLVVVERPQVNYPQQTGDIGDAIAFCCQFL
jgi:precorrin-6A/cobalt-precorrin-6A reductase